MPNRISGLVIALACLTWSIRLSAAETVIERFPVPAFSGAIDIKTDTGLIELRLEPATNGWSPTPRPLTLSWPRYPYDSKPPPVRLDPNTKYKFTLARTNLSFSDSGLELLKIEKDGETIFDGWLCEVHRTKMNLKDVPIKYGFIVFVPPHHVSNEQMSRLRMLRFPHADEFILGGCIVGSEMSGPKLVCVDCKKAYAEWLALDDAQANKLIPPLGSRLPYKPAPETNRTPRSTSR